MSVYSVIATGSQDYPSEARVHDVLYKLLTQHGRLRVAHGDALQGADKFADNWVLKFLITRHETGDLNSRVIVRRYPANWRSGNGAGMIRNAEMVEKEKYRANHGLVFLHENSPGTMNCLERLMDARIPTTIYHSDGRVEEVEYPQYLF